MGMIRYAVLSADNREVRWKSERPRCVANDGASECERGHSLLRCLCPSHVFEFLKPLSKVKISCQRMSKHSVLTARRRLFHLYGIHRTDDFPAPSTYNNCIGGLAYPVPHYCIAGEMSGDAKPGARGAFKLSPGHDPACTLPSGRSGKLDYTRIPGLQDGYQQLVSRTLLLS